MPQEALVSMVELQPGQQGLLRRVGSRDAGVLRYLSKLSLTPGQTVRLVEAAPFKGPVTVELVSRNGYQNGDATQVVGCELAEQLFILPAELRDSEPRKASGSPANFSVRLSIFQQYHSPRALTIRAWRQREDS